jgi:hypothetical protein
MYRTVLFHLEQSKISSQHGVQVALTNLTQVMDFARKH